MTSVYDRDMFHHPSLLRKMGIVAYRQWEQTRNKVPAEYFDEDEDNIVKEDEELMSLYKRHVEAANKYLSATFKAYMTDVEIVELYYNVSIGSLFLHRYLTYIC